MAKERNEDAKTRKHEWISAYTPPSHCIYFVFCVCLWIFRLGHGESAHTLSCVVTHISVETEFPFFACSFVSLVLSVMLLVPLLMMMMLEKSITKCAFSSSCSHASAPVCSFVFACPDLVNENKRETKLSHINEDISIWCAKIGTQHTRHTRTRQERIYSRVVIGWAEHDSILRGPMPIIIIEMNEWMDGKRTQQQI